MANLDEQATYQRLDPQGMAARLLELPQQCRRAWEQAQAFPLPTQWRGINRVVVLGMGGSAIGGDLLAALAAPLPVWVQRDYHLPPGVDAQTLVIATSYSGDTEETLSAFQEALTTPAQKLAVTTGGALARLARQKGIPLFQFDYPVPPRQALGYLLLPPLNLLARLGLVPNQDDDLAEMLTVLEELNPDLQPASPTTLNPAKRLAGRLQGRLALLYGAGMTAAVARRWKTQINENSKAWAFYETLPELHHNAIVGLQFPPELARQAFVVMLYSGSLPARLQVRLQITSHILARAGVEHELVVAKGNKPLSQLMGLVLFGDWVSYYLACLYETDPWPVAVIQELKERLSQI